MNPEDRKAPSLSSLKRTNAAIKRAVRRAQTVCTLIAEQKDLITQLQDLTDFNAGRINGKPEDFVPKLAKIAEQKQREIERQRGY